MQQTKARKLATPAQAYLALYRALRTVGAFRKAKQSGSLSLQLQERLMLAVTEVNGCALCSYGHSRMALEAGLSGQEIEELLGGQTDGAPKEELPAILFAQHYADTRGKPNRECMAQGLANVTGGFFATMGGCAMIGQSMININNGARHRLSGIVAALFLLGFILFLSRWIEMIPLAALIGLMFVVCEKTFEWSSLQTLRKISRQDAITVIGVTVITVLTDLAVAVLAGVVFAALVFAWQHAKQIIARSRIDANGWKVYELQGTLFFASTANFSGLFDPKGDPQHVVIEFRQARVVDHSAVEAIDALAARYLSEGKTLHLRHLSPDCLELLERAKDMVEVNEFEDPHYHIADNKLG